mmetsp:Transcript_37468/g.84471  ORF Transcript_37468/g.84471 Transcript_37468/m.84471 type:complete len:220 (+) Transcript_37468:803-1462(+)
MDLHAIAWLQQPFLFLLVLPLRGWRRPPQVFQLDADNALTEVNAAPAFVLDNLGDRTSPAVQRLARLRLQAIDLDQIPYLQGLLLPGRLLLPLLGSGLPLLGSGLPLLGSGLPLLRGLLLRLRWHCAGLEQRRLGNTSRPRSPKDGGKPDLGVPDGVCILLVAAHGADLGHHATEGRQSGGTCPLFLGLVFGMAVGCLLLCGLPSLAIGGLGPISSCHG